MDLLGLSEIIKFVGVYLLIVFAQHKRLLPRKSFNLINIFRLKRNKLVSDMNKFHALFHKRIFLQKIRLVSDYLNYNELIANCTHKVHTFDLSNAIMDQFSKL